MAAPLREDGDLVREEDPSGLLVLRSPRLSEIGVPHLFTTGRRVGGGTLDLTPLAGGVPAARGGRLPGPLAGELLAAAGAPPDARLVDVRQVHGDLVRTVAEEADGEPTEEGDALCTERPDRLLLVRVADCVPVLLSRSDGSRVAAVHAGWRGLVAGVLPRALERLGPGPHVAAVGPCLSTARFEVGDEVVLAFRRAGLGDAVRPPAGTGRGARSHVDLRAAARRQLERGGVREVDLGRSCTWGDRSLFSHRRDVTHGGRPSTGRLGALIAPRDTRLPGGSRSAGPGSSRGAEGGEASTAPPRLLS